jgi:hypothetical protein
VAAISFVNWFKALRSFNEAKLNDLLAQMEEL